MGFLDACWLSDYTRNTDPKDARKNNTEYGIKAIESAYRELLNSIAVDSTDVRRVIQWMTEFRLSGMIINKEGETNG